MWSTCTIKAIGKFGNASVDGHAGKVMTKQIGLNVLWFWSDKETKYQYHAIPSTWLQNVQQKVEDEPEKLKYFQEE